MPDDSDGSAEAGHEETLVPIEDSGEGEADWSPFDEVSGEFVPRPIPRSMAADGMPKPNLPPPKSDIPALSTETLVCMGDYSSFVLRDHFGDVIAEFAPAEVERSPHGHWRARYELVLERSKMRIERWRKRHAEAMKDPAVQAHGHDLRASSDRLLLGMMLSQSADIANKTPMVSYEWVEVEPVRSECKHYVRQLGQADYNPEIEKVFRLCSARRTTEGAFMSVSDRAVWACAMREPRDLVTEKRLDDFDAKKIQEGTERVYLPMFGGIFSGKGNNG